MKTPNIYFYTGEATPFASELSIYLDCYDYQLQKAGYVTDRSSRDNNPEGKAIRPKPYYKEPEAPSTWSTVQLVLLLNPDEAIGLDILSNAQEAGVPVMVLFSGVPINYAFAGANLVGTGKEDVFLFLMTEAAYQTPQLKAYAKRACYEPIILKSWDWFRHFLPYVDRPSQPATAQWSLSDQLDLMRAGLTFLITKGVGSGMIPFYSLKGMDLSHANMFWAGHNKADFSECLFKEAIFSDNKHLGTSFTQSQFTRASVQHSDYHLCRFDQASFEASTWETVSAQKCRFEQTDFQAARLLEVNADRSVFDAASFVGAQWTGSVLLDCSFREMQAQRMELTQLALRNCDFQGSDLSESVWEKVRAQKNDFSNSRLQGARLEYCGLRASDFRQADFRGAHLNGCNLSHSNFSGVDFSGVTLHGVNFRYADLSGAKFTGAMLNAVDFYGADLKQACFAGVDLSAIPIEALNADQAEFSDMANGPFPYTLLSADEVAEASQAEAAHFSCAES